MTTFLIFIILVPLLALLLSFPIIHESKYARLFFLSGKDQRKNLKLKRGIILENIRELEIEKDLGKISEAEFVELARPLAHTLAEQDKQLSALGSEQTDLKVTRNRLGLVCPTCAFINPDRNDSPSKYCEQCGYVFEEIS